MKCKRAQSIFLNHPSKKSQTSLAFGMNATNLL
ncbi:hypothetical protein N197_02710 [Helicobacter pylori UM023]|nr:hypothetical protein N197_02710 [Helicobacter pylori UM023]